MAFLLKEDYYIVVRQLRLEQMTDNDATLFPKINTTVLSIVRNKLFNLYDVDEVLSKTGSDRDELILLYCIQIATYLLHKRLPSVMIPEHVADDYKEVVMQLENIAKGITAIDLPRKKETDTNGDGELDDNTRFRWGKRPTRSH